jgi:hypothetical protein
MGRERGAPGATSRGSNGGAKRDRRLTSSGLRDLADTNGLGQVACGASLEACTTIGAAIKP